MLIPVYVERSDSFKNFPESSIFYTNMSFKIPNIAVKCSRSLFLFYYITLKMVKHTEKSYDFDIINFLKVYPIIFNVIFLHCIFASRRISLCFTTVKIAKTS